MPGYSPALERAIRTMVRLHEGQARKTDPGLPYITHLIHVAMLIRQHGFPEETVIAALLHDALEDTGYTPEELLADFGDPVCAIVETVTENKHLRWEERKRAYLGSVRAGSPDAKAVCCADKIHNLSSLLEEYHRHGDEVWKAFRRGRDKTLAFYDAALDAIADGWTHPLVDAYRDLLREMHATVGAPDAGRRDI